jgi:hypothetical protein
LAAEQIGAMPFKGPTLAVQAYGDLSLRSFSDLDILVRGEDVVLAREVLLSEGYVSPLKLTSAQFGALIREGYNDELYRSRDGVQVELHWRFAPAYFGFDADLPGLWQRSEQVLLQGERLSALGREDLLIMLCVHGARHAWAGLEGIVAVAELIRRTPNMDWASVAERADHGGVARMVRLGVLLAMELVDARVPEAVATRVRADLRLPGLVAQVRSALFEEESAGASDADEAENLGLLLFHLSAKDRWSHRFRFCSQMLTTTTERDWKVVPLPDPLFRLYTVVRPFRLLVSIPKYGRWLANRAGFRM